MSKLLSLLLVSLFVLSACTTGTQNATKEITPVSTVLVATEEPAVCGSDGQIFMLGDYVSLGTDPGGDYSAFLDVGKSSFLRPYNLIVVPKDGAEILLAGGSLPKSGEAITVAWGPYLEVEVENCGLFYHYKVVKLLGAVAKPVSDPSCIPADYSRDGLKPWPFASHRTVWSEGKDEVILASDSDPKMYLVTLQDGSLAETVAFRRPLKGEVTTGTIDVGGGKVSVEVKNCDGNYFFRAEYQKVIPLPPSYRRIRME